MESTDRSAQQQATQAGKTATTTGAGYGTSAAGIAGQIVPALERQAQGGQGFTPTETNKMLVAGEQGAGGANAGIVGQAGLQAARTRNSGALSGVLDSAARSRAGQLSTNALNVENESAKLAQSKQQEALARLSGLYGTDVGAQLKSMGLVPEDVNAEANAGRSGWLQNTMGVISSLGSLGGASKGPMAYV